MSLKRMKGLICNLRVLKDTVPSPLSHQVTLPLIKHQPHVIVFTCRPLLSSHATFKITLKCLSSEKFLGSLSQMLVTHAFEHLKMCQNYHLCLKTCKFPLSFSARFNYLVAFLDALGRAFHGKSSVAIRPGLFS